MKYYAKFEGPELPSLEYRDTAAEAHALIESRRAQEPHNAQAAIEVYAVRDARMSDFVDPMQFVSVMRERMVDVIGNDDALSQIDEEQIEQLGQSLQLVANQWWRGLCSARENERAIALAQDPSRVPRSLGIDGNIVVERKRYRLGERP